MENILVILGHPDYNSLNGSIFNQYIKGAKESGFNVRTLKLGNLKFDPILHNGYKKIQELETDLQKAQNDLKWAQHIVFIFPTWWGAPPALLKGFLERAILPGFAFKYKQDSMLWHKYFKGKTSRLIITMDGPKFFYKYFVGSPGTKMMEKGILNFIGVKKVKKTILSRIRFKDKNKIKKHLNKIYMLGKKGL